jgi:hypothetical protein
MGGRVGGLLGGRAGSPCSKCFSKLEIALTVGVGPKLKVVTVNMPGARLNTEIKNLEQARGTMGAHG